MLPASSASFRPYEQILEESPRSEASYIWASLSVMLWHRESRGTEQMTICSLQQLLSLEDRPFERNLLPPL